MNRDSFREFIRERRYWDQRENRYRVTPLGGYEGVGLAPGAHMIDLGDWRMGVVLEVAESDCNERRYAVEADTEGVSGLKKRRIITVKGAYALAELLGTIEAEPGGLRSAHAWVRRVDNPQAENAAREFDAEMGEGAYEAMRERLMSREKMAYALANEPRFRTPDAFWAHVVNPREKGI